MTPQNIVRFSSI